MQNNYSTMSEDAKDMDDMVYFQWEEGKECEVAMPIKVVAIDDHPLMIRMVEERLREHPDIELVGTANHSRQLMKLVRNTTPDVVILDLSLDKEKFKPARAIRTLRKEFPKTQILVLTAHEDQAEMIKLVRLGVLGYVLKTDGELSFRLAEGIRTIYRREPFYSSEVIKALASPLHEMVETNPFTEQEVEIIHYLADGLQNKAIGREMGLSEGSVGNKLSVMYAKAGLKEDEDLNNRIMLVNFARKLGILSKET